MYHVDVGNESIKSHALLNSLSQTTTIRVHMHKNATIPLMSPVQPPSTNQSTSQTITIITINSQTDLICLREPK